MGFDNDLGLEGRLTAAIQEVPRSRREFIKDIGRDFAEAGFASSLLLALAKCAHMRPPPTNMENPNFRGPGYQWHTFLGSIYNGWTPGIDWKVPSKTPMEAVAPGKVINVKTLSHGAGGYMVRVAHDDPAHLPHVADRWSPPMYSSYYAHLNSVQVKEDERVSRGQTIGHAGGSTTHSIAKLMLMEASNWVNPDNYGPNHGHMPYWDRSTNLEIDNVRKRFQNQQKLSYRLNDLILGEGNDELFLKEYRRPSHGQYCRWSYVEIFRYLEAKYLENPKDFNLAKEQFNSISKEFYANQPIIATIPFRNPKLKK